MESKLTVYGAYWCPDCRRSKKFLGENFIPFNWVDIEEDNEGEAFVITKNGVIKETPNSSTHEFMIWLRYTKNKKLPA